MTEPPSLGRRLATIATATIAAAFLWFAASSTSWLTTGTGAGFGLRRFQTCTTHGCDDKPIAAVVAELEKSRPGLTKSGFAEAGLVTTIALYAAFGLVLLPIVPLLGKTRSRLARAACRLAILALVVALGGAVVYVLRQPGGTAGAAFKLGFAFWIFSAGNVVGMTAAQMLGKLHADPDPG